MIAIISDIHANWLALQAVLDAIDKLGVSEILCLGDIVGYGPDPVPCVEAVRERCSVVLCGNHDFGIVYGANDFHPIARACLEYHRGQVMPRPGTDDFEARRLRWEFLKQLPYRYVRDETLFVHAAPRNPVIEYLRKMDVMLGMTQKIKENFSEVVWICFNGHTHRPGVITDDMKWLDPEDFGGVYQPSFQRKAIINVGSVGQPRDKDVRACFVTVNDEGHVTYHRAEYDVQAVAKKIEETPGMDHSLAERLLTGR